MFEHEVWQLHDHAFGQESAGYRDPNRFALRPVILWNDEQEIRARHRVKRSAMCCEKPS